MLSVNFTWPYSCFQAGSEQKKKSDLKDSKLLQHLQHCAKAVGRTGGFMPFPRVLVQSETQIVSSRIWTQVADSISYDNDHYTKHASSIIQHLHDTVYGD